MNYLKINSYFPIKKLAIFIGIFTLAIAQSNNSVDHKNLTVIENQNKQITLPLTIGVINKIPVKMNNGVTTIIFPGPITEIVGRNVSNTGNGTDFAITGAVNSSSFSLVAMSPNVSGTLTITYKNNLYILYIYQDNKEACATVTFSETTTFSNSNYANTPPNVSGARLISLIDLSKNYYTILSQYPALLKNATRKEFNNRYRCGNYDIHLLSVTRFDEEDTLIFQLELENLTNQEILYDKHSFSAHTGSSISYMSISDATGIMPPKSRTAAYFGITSTATGTRNNLLPDNDWLLGLSTRNMHINQITQIKDNIKADLEKKKAKEIAQAKEAAQKLKTIEKLSKQLTLEQKQLKEKLASLNKLEQNLKKLQDKLVLQEDALSKEKASFQKEKDTFIKTKEKELNNLQEEFVKKEKSLKENTQALLLKERKKIEDLTLTLNKEVSNNQKVANQLSLKEKTLIDKAVKLEQLQQQLDNKAKQLSNQEQLAQSVIQDLVTKTLPKLNSLNSKEDSLLPPSNNSKVKKDSANPTTIKKESLKNTKLTTEKHQ